MFELTRRPDGSRFICRPTLVSGYLRACSIVSADRVVFNVKGNAYRLVVSVDFEKAIVWIKWIGTHKAYDQIDVKEIEHGK